MIEIVECRLLFSDNEAAILRHRYKLNHFERLILPEFYISYKIYYIVYMFMNNKSLTIQFNSVLLQSVDWVTSAESKQLWQPLSLRTRCVLFVLEEKYPTQTTDFRQTMHWME